MKPLPGPLGNMTLEDFDGKRLRKSVMRKTVDYNAAVIKELEVSRHIEPVFAVSNQLHSVLWFFFLESYLAARL